MQRAALFSGGDAQMAAGDLGELLVPYMPTIRVPKSGDRVYKTECAFSYDSPVSAAKPPPAASAPPRRCGLPTRPQPAPCDKPAPPTAPCPLPAAPPAPRAASRPLPGPLPPPQASKFPPSPPSSARLPPPAVASSAATSPLALPGFQSLPAPARVAAGRGPGAAPCPCAARPVRGLPRPGSSGQIAAGSYAAAALVRLLVLFFSLRRSEVIAQARGFCGFWETSPPAGLWLAEPCPLLESPCFHFHAGVVKRGSHWPSRVHVLASRCQSFCFPTVSVVILFKIFQENFQSKSLSCKSV